MALLLFPRFGLFSLMIADSVKHIVHALTSAGLLARRMQGFGDQRLWKTLGKTVLAAGGMGVIGFVALPIITSTIGSATLVREVLLVLLAGGLCLLVFVGLAAVLKIEELRWLGRMLARRLGR